MLPSVLKDWKVEGLLKVMNVRGTEALVAWLVVHDELQHKDRNSDPVPDELEVKKQNFPNTREGLKHAIQHLQEAAQWLSRRGMCTDCLGREEFRALKRIRLAGHEVCGSCLVARAVAPHIRNTT